jgi:hypothetical protein
MRQVQSWGYFGHGEVAALAVRYSQYLPFALVGDMERRLAAILAADVVGYGFTA